MLLCLVGLWEPPWGHLRCVRTTIGFDFCPNSWFKNFSFNWFLDFCVFLRLWHPVQMKLLRVLVQSSQVLSVYDKVHQASECRVLINSFVTGIWLYSVNSIKREALCYQRRLWGWKVLLSQCLLHIVSHCLLDRCRSMTLFFRFILEVKFLYFIPLIFCSIVV